MRTDGPPSASLTLSRQTLAAVDATRCLARLELDAVQLAWLDRLPRPGHALVRVLRCEFEQPHAGAHACLGQHSGDTDWWVRWTLFASEIDALAPCPITRYPGDPAADDNACLLYAEHAGRHSYGSGYWR